MLGEQRVAGRGAHRAAVEAGHPHPVERPAVGVDGAAEELVRQADLEGHASSGSARTATSCAGCGRGHGRILAHVGRRATRSAALAVRHAVRRDVDRRCARATHRIHPAWWVAAVTFLALVGAAAFRAVPGVLIDPLRDEFGWSVSTISAAVAVNMALYGLTAPFAAALMERFGIRRVVMCALLVVALGSGLTVFMTTSWQLILLWGVLVGLGTGSMALSLVATVTGRWFVARRGLVSGILTAGGAAGQLIFLPLVAVDRLGAGLAGGVPRHDGRRARRPPAGGLAAARPPARPRRDARTAGRRPTTSTRCAPAPRATPSAGWSRARSSGRSGCWPAASSSAGCRPTGWCSRTSSRPRTTTACR